MKTKVKKNKEIKDYDEFDTTTTMIDKENALSFKDLGITIPSVPPTQVVSIRLPTALLNEIKALGSQNDIPYQALIKLYLSETVKKKKNRHNNTALGRVEVLT